MIASRSKGLLLVGLVALLFSVGASLPVACCAGIAVAPPAQAMSSPHCGGEGGGSSEGASCCDRAAEDPVARHCCQGGDAFERPLVAQQPALAADSTGSQLPIPARAAQADGAHARQGPVPRAEPLYTLHSSLLI